MRHVHPRFFSMGVWVDEIHEVGQDYGVGVSWHYGAAGAPCVDGESRHFEMEC